MLRPGNPQPITETALAGQAAIILLAAHSGTLPLAGIREWACSMIDLLPRPPLWLLQLATTPPEGMNGAIMTLQQQATPLNLRMRLQAIIACHASGQPLLPDTLRELFFATILDRQGQPLLPEDEPLVDALVAWDGQDDLDSIPSELEARFLDLFRDYLADAAEVFSPLRAAGLSFP
jgi:hypothetical protein